MAQFATFNMCEKEFLYRGKGSERTRERQKEIESDIGTHKRIKAAIPYRKQTNLQTFFRPSESSIE